MYYYLEQIKYLLSLLAFVVFALTLGGCGGGSSSKSLDSSNYSEVDTLDTLEDSDYYSDTTDYSPTEDTYSSSSDDESEEGEMCTMTSDCIGAVSEDVFDEVIKYSNAKEFMRVIEEKFLIQVSLKLKFVLKMEEHCMCRLTMYIKSNRRL